jgi:hypothetical protein
MLEHRPVNWSASPSRGSFAPTLVISEADIRTRQAADVGRQEAVEPVCHGFVQRTAAAKGLLLSRDGKR